MNHFEKVTEHLDKVDILSTNWKKRKEAYRLGTTAKNDNIENCVEAISLRDSCKFNEDKIMIEWWFKRGWHIEHNAFI